MLDVVERLARAHVVDLHLVRVTEAAVAVRVRLRSADDAHALVVLEDGIEGCTDECDLIDVRNSCDGLVALPEIYTLVGLVDPDIDLLAREARKRGQSLEHLREVLEALGVRTEEDEIDTLKNVSDELTRRDGGPLRAARPGEDVVLDEHVGITIIAVGITIQVRVLLEPCARLVREELVVGGDPDVDLTVVEGLETEITLPLLHELLRLTSLATLGGQVETLELRCVSTHGIV